MTEKDQLISDLYEMYYKAIVKKHELYDSIRANARIMSSIERDIAEQELSAQRVRIHTIEEMGMSLFNVNLWDMFINNL